MNKTYLVEMTQNEVEQVNGGIVFTTAALITGIAYAGYRIGVYLAE